MKYLKTIDFVGQTFIFTAFILGSVWIGVAEQRWNSLAMTTAIAMLCAGWWQMISCFLLLALKAPFRKQRAIHFSLAVLYLAIFALAGKYADAYLVASASAILKTVLLLLAVGTPASLAIFYYSITWRWMFPAKSTGRFLPHVSF
jgi:hypothetical protein